MAKLWWPWVGERGSGGGVWGDSRGDLDDRVSRWRRNQNGEYWKGAGSGGPEIVIIPFEIVEWTLLVEITS